MSMIKGRQYEIYSQSHETIHSLKKKCKFNKSFQMFVLLRCFLFIESERGLKIDHFLITVASKKL